MHELTPAEYEKVIVTVLLPSRSASPGWVDPSVRSKRRLFSKWTGSGTIRHDDASAIVAAIGRSPEPPDYDAEEVEGRRAIHEMLDLPMPAEELEQTLRAREAVQEIADALAF